MGDHQGGGAHGQPRKQRNASSAGGHRGSSTARESSSARENGAHGGYGGYSSGSVSAREHAYKDMHSAYAKPRSAYAAHKPHSAGQRGVQAW